MIVGFNQLNHPEALQRIDNRDPLAKELRLEVEEVLILPAVLKEVKFPGFFLVPNKSYIGPEISLHIRSPKGQIVVTGCAHPGIETILESSKEIDLNN